MNGLLGVGKKLRLSGFKGFISRPKTKRVLLALVVFVVVTGTLALDFVNEQVNVEAGLPSPSTFRADRTVHYVDEEKTAELQENAARLVEPVYDPDLAVNNEVLAQIAQTFATIRRVADNPNMDAEQKGEQLARELPYQLPATLWATVAQRDEEQLVALENQSLQLVQGSLQDGIREYQLEEERLRLQEQVALLPLPPEQREFLALVLSHSIKPNLVFNESETEFRRQRARANVEPVSRTIVKDYVIVREGDTVTEEHLEQLRALGLQQTGENHNSRFIGLGLVVAALLGIGLGYVYLFKPLIWRNDSYLALLGLIMVSNLLIAKLLTLIPDPLYGYLIPIAAGSMLVAILLDNHLAILFTVVMAVLVGIVSGFDLSLPLVALVGGLAGTYSVSRLNQRADLTRAGLLVAAANLITVLGVGLFTLRSWQEVSLGSFLGIINGVLAAVLTIGSLPYLENSFNLTTAVKLLEISNPNHPLLKRLLLEAPGTYHHSILVGNLSEAAAEAVGADSLLVRAGSYYHDVGKLKRPYFFIENQVLKDNPHDKVSPSLSALIITSHVKDGAELARKYRLPQTVIDIIVQHHGTSLVSYFYHRALETCKEQRISEEDFRYGGLKPQTKEAAIVMLADSVEAAVRSLARPNPSRIEGLVYKLVKERLNDGQLDECDLTFRDLNAIAGSFTMVLGGIFHTRIEYPEQESKGEGAEGSDHRDSKSTGKSGLSGGIESAAQQGG